jgi:hypothetical protein
MIIALDGFKKKEVKLSDKSRYLNTLILGQKGTGKSDHVLLNMFQQDLEKKDHSLFVFTSKGDTSYKLYALAKHMGRKVHLIKPETHSFHINLLKGDEQDVMETLGELFSYAFYPANHSEVFFREMNKTLFTYAIKVVKRICGDKATLADVYELITNVDGAGRKQLLKFSRMKTEDEYIKKENQEIKSWFEHQYFNEKTKVFEHCIGLRMKVRELVYNQHHYGFEPAEEGLPDFQKVLKNKEIVIVDTEYLKFKEYSTLMGTYLLMKMQNELLGADTAEAFVYLDDFQKFYPVLTELMEGSHIRNVGLTLFLQDTKQLNGYPEYKNVILNSVSNLILLERIAIEDYHFYKEQMNAELLNRKRSEIVYKIINKDGTSESTNGTLYASERLILQYEKYLDHKKQLMKKKKKKVAPKKKEEILMLPLPVEKTEEKPVEEPVQNFAEKIIEPTYELVEEEKTVEEMKDKKIEEKTAEVVQPKIAESDGFIMVSKVFEQIKREGDGKEYLSPDEVFEEEDLD